MLDGWGADEQWDSPGDIWFDGFGDGSGIGSADGSEDGFSSELVWDPGEAYSAADSPEGARDNGEPVQDSAKKTGEPSPEAKEEGTLVPGIDDDAPLEIELSEVVKANELLGQQTEEKLDVIVGSFDMVTQKIQQYTEQNAEDTQSILDALESIHTELGNVKTTVNENKNTLASIDGNLESIKDDVSTLVYYTIANSNYEKQVKTYWEMGIGLVAMITGGLFAYVLLRRLLT